MEHDDLWIAIEMFAKSRGTSCSGMARKCGLDATIFNKSKRHSRFGQPRWVSTETIAKVINTYGVDIHEFVDSYVPRH